MDEKAQFSCEALIAVAAYAGFCAVLVSAALLNFSEAKDFASRHASLSLELGCASLLDSFYSNSLLQGKNVSCSFGISFPPFFEPGFLGEKILAFSSPHYRWVDDFFP